MGMHCTISQAFFCVVTQEAVNKKKGKKKKERKK